MDLAPLQTTSIFKYASNNIELLPSVLWLMHALVIILFRITFTNFFFQSTVVAGSPPSF